MTRKARTAARPTRKGPKPPVLVVHTTKAHEPLARAIAERCSASGIKVRVARTPRIAFDGCRLEFSDRTALGDGFAELLTLIDPIEFTRSRDQSLANTVHLWLAGPRDAFCHPVTVRCPDRLTGEAFARGLRDLGFEDVEVESVAGIAGDELLHPSAPMLARDAIGFMLRGVGAVPIEVECAADSAGDARILVNLLTPALPALTRSLVLETDDAGAALDMVAAFHHAGFRHVTPRIVDEGALDRVTLDPGGLEAAGEEGVIARLITTAAELLPQDDDGSYPIRRVKPEAGRPVIRLPRAGIRSGRLCPYAGASLRRWRVIVRSDDDARGARLVEAMKARGFERVARRRLREGADPGFAVKGGGTGRHRAAAAEAAIEVLRGAMSTVPEAAGLAISTSIWGEDHIEVTAPFGGALSGMLELELGDAGRIAVELVAPEREAGRARRLLREIGFRRIRVHHDNPDVDLIEVGAASDDLIATLRRRLRDRLDAPMPRAVRRWRANEARIRISITERSALSPAEPARPGRRQKGHATSKAAGKEGSWSMMDHGYAGPLELELVGARPFIEVDEGEVRIGRITLERRQPGLAGVPRAPMVFTVDPIVAMILDHLADAIALGDHVLLEGETGVSKTSAIDYLLHLLGCPRHRSNLSGQTDVLDLTGRVLPGEDGLAWHNGPVPVAMLRGSALVLDEINLAPPHVLDRLNSLTEDPPSFTLDEDRGDFLEASPGFFFASTCNPLTYAGCEELDEAFSNRLTPLLVPRPEARDHEAFLRHCLLGETPAIVLDSIAYCGTREEPAYPVLGAMDEMTARIRPLAEFQAAVEAAARHGTGTSQGCSGSGKRAFTRRQLIKAIRKIDREVGLGESLERAVARGIERYYLRGLAGAAFETARDLAVAHDLIRLRRRAA